MRRPLGSLTVASLVLIAVLVGPATTSASAPAGADTPAPPQDPAAVCEAMSAEESVDPTPLAPAAGGPDATVTVDLDDPIGPANLDLTGMVWNTGPDLDAVAELRPTTIRVDASLQRISPAPGQFDIQPLLDRIAEIRSIGAEPIVLLSYMPRWLGQPSADTRNPDADPTRMAPYDLDAWQQLIHDVVQATATAPAAARIYEVWNEPDWPVFWHDTDQHFIDTAVRTHRAVADVKAATGLDLQIGGPSLAFSGSASSPRITGYVQALIAEGLALDFWSWHRYANFPFLGPDGNEGHVDPDLYEALGKVNPNATPLDYSAEIEAVRARVADLVAGSDLDPWFTLDEWNVSGGGLDLRHDSAVGAAFDAGILIEMERAGLDSANFYRSASGSRPGDWGLVAADGTRKPAWWLMRAWATMTGDRLAATDAPVDGLFSRATRDAEGCLRILVVNFLASGGSDRTVQLDLAAGQQQSCSATIAALDTESTTLDQHRTIPISDTGTATVHLPAQSLVLVRANCVDRIAPTTTAPVTTTPPVDPGIPGSSTTPPSTVDPTATGDPQPTEAPGTDGAPALRAEAIEATPTFVG